MLDPLDYKEPACALCGGEAFYNFDPKKPQGHIPVDAVIRKLDDCLARENYAEGARVLRYWIEDAKALNDRRGELSVQNEVLGLSRRIGDKPWGLAAVERCLQLIAEIGAGIKKEVSVGCAVASCICSVCGADARKTPCKHRRGKSYNGQICHFVLENPTDAYEWSFVAVPAQKNAGVTKGFEDFGTLKTRLFSDEREQVVLSKKEAQTISDYLESVREDAENGRAYHAQLCETAVKGFAKVMPTLDNRVAETLCRGLSVADLKALNTALAAENEKTAVSLRPFLAADETKTPQNEQFKF